MNKTPFDKQYRKYNQDRIDWWDRYDMLPAEAKELIQTDNCEPTPEILLVVGELHGIAYPELPKSPLNAKQRAWLKRREDKLKAARDREAKWRNSLYHGGSTGIAQSIAPVTTLTKQELVKLRTEVEQRSLTAKELEQRKLHKVLGLTKKVKASAVALYND